MAADKYTPEFHEGVLTAVQRQNSSSSSATESFSSHGPRDGSVQVRLASEVVTALGQPTTLECLVVQWSAGRTVEVQWLHGGRKCEGENYSKFCNGGWQYLCVKETCLADEGTYKVVVEEDGVRAESSVNVRVAQPALQTGELLHNAAISVSRWQS